MREKYLYSILIITTACPVPDAYRLHPLFSFFGGDNMGTPAIIEFRDDTTSVFVYKHSDGYPEGTIPLLYLLYNVLKTTGTIRDAPYTAANFIFIAKTKSMLSTDGIRGFRTFEDFVNMLYDTSQPFCLLGYGVEPDDGAYHLYRYTVIVNSDKFVIQVHAEDKIIEISTDMDIEKALEFIKKELSS